MGTVDRAASEGERGVSVPGSWSTRFVLFTGKGGVGKTTVACASAVRLADAGGRVLVVSTDPASNLSEVFDTEAGHRPTEVPGIARLAVMDLDPQRAASEYRERVLAPYRGVLPAAELAAFEEQLAGACTVEVAAFDAFSHLLADPEVAAGFDHVFFDTAPTGHTLRLVSLPAAWVNYVAANPDAVSCLGPAASVEGAVDVYEAALAVLTNPKACTVVLVARPERSATAEAARTATELTAQGIACQQLVMNGILEHPLPGDRIAQAYAHRQQRALGELPAPLSALPRVLVPLVAFDVVGVDALRSIATGTTPSVAPSVSSEVAWGAFLPSVDALVDSLVNEGPCAVLVTGKGGVGKTSIAVHLARDLAQRGNRVHLSTTDPAGSLLAEGEEQVDSLTTSRIDPGAETERYVAEKLAEAAGRPAAERAALEEELRSPCTQELAVFLAFTDLLRRARDEWVVIDTAPTGHTLLLLDVTGAFHRQVMSGGAEGAGRLVTPLMRLQDPDFTRLIIVTLAETTPISEASDLQDDLRRAGIEPYGWVVNASLAATGTRDPVLASRARLEAWHFGEVRDLAHRAWANPWDPGLVERDEAHVITTTAAR